MTSETNGNGIHIGNGKHYGLNGNHGEYPNVTVVNSRSVNYLLTKLRNKDTKAKDFMVYGDRLMRILAEEALCRLPNVQTGAVETPCGNARGLLDKWKLDICLVSVVRSGDILQEAVRQIVPGVKVGKILIQRDETSIEKLPKLFYKKFPKDIADCFVMLVDPMMATSGSAKMAIQVLAKANVRPENIMFLNLICAPEGLKALTDEYPQVQVVTGAIDDCLDENRFIVPGLGDYGDRYYGTEGSI